MCVPTYPEGRVDSERCQLQGYPDQNREQLLLGWSKARKIVGQVYTWSRVGVVVRGTRRVVRGTGQVVRRTGCEGDRAAH